MIKDRPRVLVFAGPNGSGKSTITKGYPIEGAYINADDIKQYRNCSDIEAAREAELLRESLIDSRKDLSFETVLSTERNLILLKKAKSRGYYIESVFVLTADVEVNVKRIKARVLKGGHGVPEERIRSRYAKSLGLLKELAVLSDECIVVDNTIRPEIIYKKDAAGEVYLANEFWEEEDIRNLLAAA
jgi:predicted ABC-type ATPase